MVNPIPLYMTKYETLNLNESRFGEKDERSANRLAFGMSDRDKQLNDVGAGGGTSINSLSTLTRTYRTTASNIPHHHDF